MGWSAGQGAWARRACWLCLPVCLFALVVGCKGSRRSIEHVEVSGTVRYKDRSGQMKPLPGGMVTFVAVGEGGFSADAKIGQDGTYKINAPVADVKITVDNSMLNPKSPSFKQPAARRGAGRPDAGEPDPPTGTYVEISGKYKSADTTTLTYTVTNGPQTHDIELTD